MRRLSAHISFMSKQDNNVPNADADQAETIKPTQPKTQRPKEIGGPKGPEPTRYGDWEKDGRCVDF
ncbi:succinate dehydrogenase assembly factor 4 [Rhodospirillaceae bacterium SYSU D60014]|uniref:DUF1674 domain-containing protein n=1 Tax=Virgifigura deserti TaxID=2268457 RepID=UPI0013C4CFC5